MKVRIAHEHDGALLRLTLADAPLDGAMLRAIAAALATADAGTKLVVFDGEHHFSRGGDASTAELHALFRRLIDLGIPAAAVVRGDCIGPALELAAFCNFVFAARDARFGGCPLPAFVLPLKLGRGNAEDLVLCGDTLSADEAYRRGLVLATAPAAALGALVDAWLGAHVLDKPAASLRRAHAAARLPFHRQLVLHAAAFDLIVDARAYSASHVLGLRRS